MPEHDPEREEPVTGEPGRSEDARPEDTPSEDARPEDAGHGKAGPGNTGRGKAGPGEARPPLDEDAAWNALVKSFDAVPEPGAHPWPDAEDIGQSPQEAADGGPDGNGPDTGGPDGNGPAGDGGKKDGGGAVGLLDGRWTDAARSIAVGAQSGRSPGPRDWEAAGEDDDEGHFVPPEPPPLPQADTTTKFAWLGALGGPLLLLAFVVLRQPLTWWATLLGVGGFLGGFGTLVARMQDRDDDDHPDPGGGAVV
ncbi:hypothetical protein [Streptomyces sp. HB2AG]|uniref:hypothetical protein n=1 Tax=Streptomyces sp. HB2AG TaxID=2983400 RepID=UPI0022AABD33|nr:hypothetical protein [Streptomyces sp. HB2AG]MCZ2524449.1 hypothetical protein [Streptomyces sp. HB2AG]